MKNYYKIIFVLILATLAFSCNNEEPNGRDEKPSSLKFKIVIINKSDLSADITLKKVEFGIGGLDNTSDIFGSVDDYNRFKNNYPIKEDFEEYDIIDYKNISKTKIQLGKDSTDDIFFNEFYYSGNFQSVLLRFNFSNKEERILFA